MKRSLFLVMKPGLITLLTLSSIICSAQVSPSAAADWERARAYTLEYLNAANDEVIGFAPTPEMRTFGKQMLHIAEANYGFASTASGKASPFTFGDLENAGDKYKTKEALTKAVMDSYDFVLSALRDLDKSRLNESIKMFNRFEMTREVAFKKAFEHQTHHRGQTTVYLRLKGITPPNEKLF